MKRHIIWTVFAVLMLSGIAAAQQTSITGTVVDTSGAVIVSAKVVAQIPGGTSYNAVTDQHGNFQFPNLNAADYALHVTANGFTPAIHSLTLLVGQTANVTITLQAAGASTTITVSNNTPQLQTVTSQISGNITPTQMNALPLNGRDYMDLALLVPGVRVNDTSSNSPLGSLNSGREQFNLDGQEVTGNGAAPNFGQAQFSQDAIEQFQIITNQFDATQGRTTQIVINTQSKSGTDQLHGTAFEYARNSFFDAADPITKTVLPFSDQQFGGTLGGPIKKNKLWYFGSYEMEYRPQTSNSTLIDWGPNPPSYSLSSTLRTNKVMGRADYQPTAKDHIFARYFFYNLNQPNILSGSQSISQAYSSYFPDWGVAASWNKAVTSNFVNTVLFGWYYQNIFNEPISLTPQFVFPTQSIGAADNYPSNLPVSIFQFRDDLFWLKGKHSIKAGGEFIYELNDGDFPLSVRGLATFSQDPPLGYPATFPNQLDASTWDLASISPYVLTYTQGFGSFATDIKQKTVGAWIQDDWRLLPNFTANLGFRYDNDLGILAADTVAINGVVGPTHGDNYNFQPRIGFAYDIGGHGKTVIRGGIGMYYADIVANQIFDAQVFNGARTVQAAATITPGFSLADPYPGQDTSEFAKNPQNVYQAIEVMDPKIKTPWSNMESIGVQQSLGYGMAASLEYTGLRVHHDWARQSTNVLYNPATGWNQTNFGPVSAACPNQCVTSAVTPNTHYSTIETFATPDYVGSLMSNILVSISARARHGLSGTAAYTYGLEKDNSGGAFSTPSNNWNYANEWARSVDDQRHTLSINVIEQWKWGLKGSILYHYGSGLAGNPTTGASSPGAMSQVSNRSFCLEPAGYVPYTTLPGSMCSHISQGAPASGTSKAVKAGYIAKVYNNPKYNHYDSSTGLTTVDRNSFSAEPIQRVSANLAKTITLHERYKVTPQISAFNLFNHSNYGSYQTNIALSNYGHPKSTSGDLAYFARQLQFSVRLDF